MSRIEEAFRLSASAEAVSAKEVSTTGVFKSPWDFQDTRLLDSTESTMFPVREPDTDGPAVIRDFNSKWKERLVISTSPEPFLVEQFRRLAATLHQMQASNGIRKVMITSALPNDGKTLTAVNLALTLSESYKRRVLLVDADLRRPSIRDVAHLPNVLGLADALRASTEQKLTIFQLTRRLALLPAGRPDPDPMSSLTSVRMSRILDDACRHFDWVVMDVPPVGTVADASILADMADTSLLVVRAGRTDYSVTQKAIDAIGRERILGVVLNAVEDIEGPTYGYYNALETSEGRQAPL